MKKKVHNVGCNCGGGKRWEVVVKDENGREKVVGSHKVKSTAETLAARHSGAVVRESSGR